MNVFKLHLLFILGTCCEVSEFCISMTLVFPLFQFKIALCQLLVTADKERNIAHARKAIEEAAQKGAQLVVLPVSL